MENKTDKSRVNESKLNAKKYLEEYDLEIVISEMLNSVVHEKDKHPLVYMIKYLAGLMSEEEREQFNLSIPGPYPAGRPIVRYPKFDLSFNSVLKSNLTKDKWNELRSIKTKHGNNINSLTKLSNNKPLDPIGCVIVDGDCINVYSSLLNNIISSVHLIPSDLSTLKEYRISQFDSMKANELPIGSNDLINKANKIILSFSRNISDYPFNHFSSGTNKLASVEELLNKAILTLQSDSIISACNQYSMKNNQNEIMTLLDYVHFDMEWYNASGLNQSWPECRSVFATNDKSLIILINFSDHMQICLTNEKGNIDLAHLYNTAIEILKQIGLMVNYESSKQFGFLTSHINLIGAGFKISSVITIEELITHKFNNNITIDDILKGLSFDMYSLENTNSELFSCQSCKLSYDNDKAFMINYILKICGLIEINTNNDARSEISFEKLKFDKDKCDDKTLMTIYENYFDKIKYLITIQGKNINSLIEYTSLFPEDKMGIIIHDLSDYNTFLPLIQQYVLLSQNFNPITTDHINKPDEPKKMIDITPEDSAKISNVTISIMRNIEGKQLPHSQDNSNSKIEEIIKQTIDTINKKGYFADYFSIADGNINENVNQMITDNNLILYHNDNMSQCSIDQDYPLHRGIIKFYKDNLFAVVNDMDHIRFILHIKELREKFGFSLFSLLKIVNEFSKHIVFSYNIKLGFLTTNPRYLGTGLKIKLTLKLNYLNKKALEEYLEENNNDQFEYHVIEDSDCIEDNSYQIEVRNKTTIGVSESELLTNLLAYLDNILLQDRK